MSKIFGALPTSTVAACPLSLLHFLETADSGQRTAVPPIMLPPCGRSPSKVARRPFKDHWPSGNALASPWIPTPNHNRSEWWWPAARWRDPRACRPKFTAHCVKGPSMEHCLPQAVSSISCMEHCSLQRHPTVGSHVHPCVHCSLQHPTVGSHSHQLGLQPLPLSGSRWKPQRGFHWRALRRGSSTGQLRRGRKAPRQMRVRLGH